MAEVSAVQGAGGTRPGGRLAACIFSSSAKAENLVSTTRASRAHGRDTGGVAIGHWVRYIAGT